MNNSFLIRLVLPVAFMGLLAGCFSTIPDRLDFSVINGREPDGFVVCSGGLKATFEAGSLNLESPSVAPLDDYQDVLQNLPSDVGIGTPVKIEAWCYDAEDPEATGYIRIEGPWVANSINDVSVYPGGDENVCHKGTEEVAPIPCVRSFLLEDE